MCGIAGIIGSGFGDRIAMVRRMSEVIAHRGPDDLGEWSEDQAALAHRRLSILDLSPAGHQPMVSHCGRYVMVYNGELYNYLELRSGLQRKGVEFRGNSDSEVLLAAYVEYGSACLEQFNGMWAFAIWDRMEHSLFASRDRFGKKPFYYVNQSGRLIFASEIKAILATGQVDPVPNPVAVADFCAERVSDHTTGTFFQGIHQLPPASWLRWKDGRIVIDRYWVLPGDNNEPAGSGEIDEIRDRLHDAVRLRLRADTPIGTLLSGGLDSSGVTCLAAQLSGASIHAFSTIDRQPVEEAAGIDQVLAAHSNVFLHRDQPDAKCLEEELNACLWHQEEPFADGSMLAHFRLMRLARDQGVKVLMTGQGADEVFAGYPGHLQVHLAGLIAQGAWREVAGFTKSVKATGQTLPIKSVLGYAMPPIISSRLRAIRSHRSVDWLVDDFSKVSLSVAGGYVREPVADPLNGALRESILRRTLPGFLHYEDRNSMAFGVETRLPFLDFRLVEKILPMLGSLKLQGGKTKALLRKALSGSVPSPIVNRVMKQGYPAPLADWLRSSKSLFDSAWLNHISSCPLMRFESWLHRYKNFMAGKDAELPAVWRGLILALWYQRFIETRP